MDNDEQTEIDTNEQIEPTTRPTDSDRRTFLKSLALVAPLGGLGGGTLLGNRTRTRGRSVIWSQDAMAAVPTPATLRADLYDSVAGRVKFRSGRTGTVNLISAIPATLHKRHLRSLFLTYQDGDGRQGPARVSAALRMIRRRDGHVETVRNGGVSSNDRRAPNSGPRGWVTHQSATRGNTIDHRLDFEKNYYYVQITLRRSDPTVPLGAIGVYLTE